MAVKFESYLFDTDSSLSPCQKGCARLAFLAKERKHTFKTGAARFESMFAAENRRDESVQSTSRRRNQRDGRYRRPRQAHLPDSDEVFGAVFDAFGGHKNFSDLPDEVFEAVEPSQLEGAANRADLAR